MYATKDTKQLKKFSRSYIFSIGPKCGERGGYLSSAHRYRNYVCLFQAFEELEDLLAVHNICIAVKEKLVKDSGVADESAYDNIVQKLLTKPRARGKLVLRRDT
jgi:hypothetical protein